MDNGMQEPEEQPADRPHSFNIIPNPKPEDSVSISFIFSNCLGDFIFFSLSFFCVRALV